MPLKEIPYIDQAVWDIINPFLTQLHNPGNGGFQIYTESMRPNNLTINDVGKTIWNSTKGCFQEWSGGYWVDLSPKKGAIEDVVIDIIRTWNPTKLPQWLIKAINDAIDTLSIETLQSVLDSWTPSITAKIRAVIKTIALGVLRDGLTPVNKEIPIPTWLSNYITGLLTTLSTATISLSQIAAALQTYWTQTLKPYIDGKTTLKINGKDTTLQTAIDDLIEKYDALLLSYEKLPEKYPILTATPTPTPRPTPTSSPTLTPTPTPTPTPRPLSNVQVTLIQKPGTMRVSTMPPYNQTTTPKVVEAAFDITITYTGIGIMSCVANTYYAPANSYRSPSGEISGYLMKDIGNTASPYQIQNYYLAIVTTQSLVPRKTWKYYVMKGNDASNYMHFDTNTNWNKFMSTYYLDHVEIPYGGFDAIAWDNFWSGLDTINQQTFPLQ